MTRRLRSSRFLDTVTLLSRRSWTRWRRNRRLRKLRREARRLEVLALQFQAQEKRVRQLEAKLHPQLVLAPEPRPPAQVVPMQARVRQLEQTEPPEPLEETEPPVETEPLEETEMPKPLEEIAQRLGLPTPQS